MSYIENITKGNEVSDEEVPQDRALGHTYGYKRWPGSKRLKFNKLSVARKIWLKPVKVGVKYANEDKSLGKDGVRDGVEGRTQIKKNEDGDAADKHQPVSSNIQITYVTDYTTLSSSQACVGTRSTVVVQETQSVQHVEKYGGPKM